MTSDEIKELPVPYSSEEEQRFLKEWLDSLSDEEREYIKRVLEIEE